MSKIICPICQMASVPYYPKGRANYFRCNSCETIFQFPLPTIQEMMSYANTEYDNGMYKEYLKADELKYSTFEYRLEKTLQIFSHVNKQGKSHLRILDVGCSNGRFIDVALKNGHEAWGLEFSESAIAAASPNIQERIIHGDANTIDELGMESFDVVTAFDLIEHLFDPTTFLRNLRKVTSKNGIVVFTTPDASSPLRLIMGKNWSMLQPYQHTVLLSRKSVIRLLRLAGYNPQLVEGTKKYFSLDYLFGQLQAVNPTLNQTYNKIKEILPRFIREKRFGLNIGEMIVGASS